MIIADWKKNCRQCILNVRSYDYNNDIERLNKFPAKKEYRTFLLDEENNVILIGAPTHNDKLWELYKRQIRELTAKE